jgi:hypothetical protein
MQHPLTVWHTGVNAIRLGNVTTAVLLRDSLLGAENRYSFLRRPAARTISSLAKWERRPGRAGLDESGNSRPPAAPPLPWPSAGLARQQRKGRNSPTRPGPPTPPPDPLGGGAAGRILDVTVMGSSGKAPHPRPGRAPALPMAKLGNLPSLTPCLEVVRTDAPPPHARRAAATERRLPRRSARPAPGRPEIRARDRRSARHLASDEAAAWREFVRDAVPGVLTGSGRMALEALARLLARSRRQGLTSAELGHLRGFLAELDATPASRGRCGRRGPARRPRRAIHGTCRPARGRHRPSGHAGAVRLAVSGQSRTVRNG